MDTKKYYRSGDGQGITCRGCGCRVDDMQQHDTWHTMQDQMMARALNGRGINE